MRGTGLRRGFVLCAVLAGAIALGAAGPACKTDGGKPSSAPVESRAPTVTIDTGTRKISFRVEVALTSEQHARGLMNRERLDADAGMLFVFDEPRVQVFWMKNTLIPLDMIFIDADRRIVGIVENAEPETLTERKVAARSLYVFEIGGGLSSRLGLRVGQTVAFQAIPSL